MNLNRYLKSRKEIVEEELKKYFPEELYPEVLANSIRYSLLDGGKRVRPVLVLAVADLFNTPYEKVLPFACAIEMIHTYTLIHDDLPAMDNDDYRRGKLTNHKVYGDAIAILAGDALLTEAFRIMSEESLAKGIEPKKALKAIYEIAFRCGISGVVGGQVMDIISENRDIDMATIEYIHTHKTGALILASIRVGAILSRTTSKDIDRLTNYGKKIGLAFQIMDDILDIESSFEKLGKKTGADIEKKKNTYPSVIGLRESKELLNDLTEDAIDAISFYGERAKILKDFAIYLRDRQN
ncbi:MAG: polyprenyl synthetase family protein [Proteobacteria bacterium]|nr:polyprenyl synthetase family protein [Pseudomonadota bacterium]